MARNLSRNTELYISTIAPATIAVGTAIGDSAWSALGDNNTWKVNVLDGYSFSQDVATQEISVSESSSECVGAGGLSRGSLSFNTALNPVDVSFSTYVRPYDATGTLGGGEASCVELPLWAGALGDSAALALSPETPANLATFDSLAGATDTLTFTTEQSDINELMPLYLYFKLENTTYVVSEVNIGTAEVDFSIDGIATINWSGTGTAVAEDPAAHIALGTLVADTDYVDVPVTNSTSFLRNKLSTLELVDSAAVTTPIVAAADGQGFTESTGILLFTTDLSAGGATDANVANGRIRNITSSPNEWATIIDSAIATDSITIHPADRALVATWTVTTLADDMDIHGAADHAATIFCIPITGATLSLENNLSYLTPEELAIVNQPLAGFTGSRLISGSFTAYLNTGAQGTGGLLDDLLSKIAEVSNDFDLKFHMGGAASDAPRVDFLIPHAQISIPSTNVEDVISTEISFVAKSWNTTDDEQTFEGANEMTVVYVTQQA